MFCLRTRALALLMAASVLVSAAFSGELKVGSKAPKISIEHWVSNNDGKFPKVQSFEPDKVYVIEFWATWCGPCVASMPHIVKLQKEYQDRGVQIISISDEDLEDVEKFLSRTVPGSEKSAGGKKQTFGELTSTYCLTTDPDQSVYRDYMEAAGEGGIPTAFLVGKDGIIEWIGHPMELDEPLEKVVEGKWDRQAYIKKQAERDMIEEAISEVDQLVEKGSTEKALKKVDELMEKVTDPELKALLSGYKIQILIEGNPTEAAKQIKDLTAKSTSSSTLNMIAWQIAELAKDDSKFPKALIDAGAEAAEKAVKLDPNDGAVLDTLAHLTDLQGNLDKAIELQIKAVKLAPEMEELKSYLETLQEKKAASAKKK